MPLFPISSSRLSSKGGEPNSPKVQFWEGKGVWKKSKLYEACLRCGIFLKGKLVFGLLDFSIFRPCFLRRFCGDFHLLSLFCGDFAAISRLKFGKYFQKWKLYFLIRNIEKPFIYGSFSIFSLCDPVGIQTQDLQNRNLTLYSAKLRDRWLLKSECKDTKKM